MEKKILILTGDCAEDYEVKVPQQALQMLGYKVDITAPNKKPGICCSLLYTILLRLTHTSNFLDTAFT